MPLPLDPSRIDDLGSSITSFIQSLPTTDDGMSIHRAEQIQQLARSMFANRGVELSVVKHAVKTSCIPLLTEIVCILLERQSYCQHNNTHLFDIIPPGSRFTELACIEFLGLNKGRIPLSNTYFLPYLALTEVSTPELIDFVRLLRSRMTWTSSSFRHAITKSEYYTYKQYLEDQLVHIPSSQHPDLLLSKAYELAFHPHYARVQYELSQKSKKDDISSIIQQPEFYHGHKYERIEYWLTIYDNIDLFTLEMGITKEIYQQTVSYIFDRIVYITFISASKELLQVILSPPPDLDHGLLLETARVSPLPPLTDDRGRLPSSLQPSLSTVSLGTSSPASLSSSSSSSSISTIDMLYSLTPPPHDTLVQQYHHQFKSKDTIPPLYFRYPIATTKFTLSFLSAYENDNMIPILMKEHDKLMTVINTDEIDILIHQTRISDEERRINEIKQIIESYTIQRERKLEFIRYYIDLVGFALSHPHDLICLYIAALYHQDHYIIEKLQVYGISDNYIFTYTIHHWKKHTIFPLLTQENAFTQYLYPPNQSALAWKSSNSAKMIYLELITHYASYNQTQCIDYILTLVNQRIDQFNEQVDEYNAQLEEKKQDEEVQKAAVEVDSIASFFQSSLSNDNGDNGDDNKHMKKDNHNQSNESELEHDPSSNDRNNNRNQRRGMRLVRGKKDKESEQQQQQQQQQPTTRITPPKPLAVIDLNDDDITTISSSINPLGRTNNNKNNKTSNSNHHDLQDDGSAGDSTPAQYIPHRTFNDLLPTTLPAGSSSIIAICCSLPSVTVQTIKYLVKHKLSKVNTNSTNGAGNNVFYRCLTSVAGNMESRLELLQYFYAFTQRNKGFKPSISWDEYLQILRHHWNARHIPGRFNIELLTFAKQYLLPKAEYEQQMTFPEKVLREIAHILDISLPREYDPYATHAWHRYGDRILYDYHQNITKVLQLFISVHNASQMFRIDEFTNITSILLSSRCSEGVRYLCSLGYRPTVDNDVFYLGLLTHTAMDIYDMMLIQVYRDDINVSNHINDDNNDNNDANNNHDHHSTQPHLGPQSKVKQRSSIIQGYIPPTKHMEFIATYNQFSLEPDYCNDPSAMMHFLQKQRVVSVPGQSPSPSQQQQQQHEQRRTWTSIKRDVIAYYTYLHHHPECSQLDLMDPTTREKTLSEISKDTNIDMKSLQFLSSTSRSYIKSFCFYNIYDQKMRSNDIDDNDNDNDDDGHHGKSNDETRITEAITQLTRLFSINEQLPTHYRSSFFDILSILIHNLAPSPSVDHCDKYDDNHATNDEIEHYSDDSDHEFELEGFSRHKPSQTQAATHKKQTQRQLRRLTKDERYHLFFTEIQLPQIVTGFTTAHSYFTYFLMTMTKCPLPLVLLSQIYSLQTKHIHIMDIYANDLMIYDILYTIYASSPSPSPSPMTRLTHTQGDPFTVTLPIYHPPHDLNKPSDYIVNCNAVRLSSTPLSSSPSSSSSSQLTLCSSYDDPYTATLRLTSQQQQQAITPQKQHTILSFLFCILSCYINGDNEMSGDDHSNHQSFSPQHLRSLHDPFNKETSLDTISSFRLVGLFAQMIPQSFIKIFLMNAPVDHPCLYNDMVDLFIAYGGVLFASDGLFSNEMKGGSHALSSPHQQSPPPQQQQDEHGQKDHEDAPLHSARQVLQPLYYSMKLYQIQYHLGLLDTIQYYYQYKQNKSILFDITTYYNIFNQSYLTFVLTTCQHPSFFTRQRSHFIHRYFQLFIYQYQQHQQDHSYNDHNDTINHHMKAIDVLNLHKNIFGENLLMIAIGMGQQHMIQDLLPYVVDFNIFFDKDAFNRTFLHHLASHSQLTVKQYIHGVYGSTAQELCHIHHIDDPRLLLVNSAHLPSVFQSESRPGGNKPTPTAGDLLLAVSQHYEQIGVKDGEERDRLMIERYLCMQSPDTIHVDVDLITPPYPLLYDKNLSTPRFWCYLYQDVLTNMSTNELSCGQSTISTKQILLDYFNRMSMLSSPSPLPLPLPLPSSQQHQQQQKQKQRQHYTKDQCESMLRYLISQYKLIDDLRKAIDNAIPSENINQIPTQSHKHHPTQHPPQPPIKPESKLQQQRQQHQHQQQSRPSSQQRPRTTTPGKQPAHPSTGKDHVPDTTNDGRLITPSSQKERASLQQSSQKQSPPSTAPTSPTITPIEQQPSISHQQLSPLLTQQQQQQQHTQYGGNSEFPIDSPQLQQQQSTWSLVSATPIVLGALASAALGLGYFLRKDSR